MAPSLVAFGKIQSAYQTLEVTYAISDPLWHPQSSGVEPRIDQDLLDKQAEEDRLGGQ